jgi:hypothetical protein
MLAWPSQRRKCPFFGLRLRYQLSENPKSLYGITTLQASPSKLFIPSIFQNTCPKGLFLLPQLPNGHGWDQAFGDAFPRNCLQVILMRGPTGSDNMVCFLIHACVLICLHNITLQ